MVLCSKVLPPLVETHTLSRLDTVPNTPLSGSLLIGAAMMLLPFAGFTAIDTSDWSSPKRVTLTSRLRAMPRASTNSKSTFAARKPTPLSSISSTSRP
jgi:hypothetical protein